MKDALDCVMEIGEQMLVSGAEVHRVEESVDRMCRALGAARVDVFIITTSMVVTVHAADGQTDTQTRRIYAITYDFEKLHRLNALSREICEKKELSPEEIADKLRCVIDCRKYPLWAEVVCYAVIAAVFTLFFGGTWKEAAISLCIGICVRIGLLFCDKVIHNKIFQKFFSSVIITGLALGAVRCGWVSKMDNIMTGNIMSLIPGIGLTTALRDLFVGDSIAGLLRSIEAILAALAIAAGYVLIAALGGVAL